MNPRNKYSKSKTKVMKTNKLTFKSYKFYNNKFAMIKNLKNGKNNRYIIITKIKNGKN